MNNKKIIILGLALIIIFGIIFFIVVINKDYSISAISKNNLDCFTKSKKCDVGTKLRINVNKKEVYDFHVIEDDGNKLTLIMSKNIGKNLFWSENKSCANGPKNLIDYIDDLTGGWSNIQKAEYTISDSNKCYADMVVKMRARIPTLEDLDKLGCKYYYQDTCPEYIISGLDDKILGYWLSTTWNPIDNNASYIVYKNGSLGQVSNITDNYYGLRLVIEVEK